MHAHQDPDRERIRRARCRSRSRLRSADTHETQGRHEARQGAEGRTSREVVGERREMDARPRERHGREGARPVYRAEHGRGEGQGAHRAADLPRRGRQAARAEDGGRRQRTLPHQCVHDGRGFSAQAPHRRGRQLIGREDEDVSHAVREFLEGEGIEVRLGAQCLALKKTKKGVAIGVECEAGAPAVHGSHILLAVGRAPNTDDLGLEAAGIETDERGYIKVDEELRTTNPGVWALGDCNGKGAFTHTAYNDFEIVADNLLNGAKRKWTDRVPVYALYTDPPLGRVGMSETEIRKAGIKALVGKRPMSRVARAVEKGETAGFLKIHVEEGSQRILGAALLGTSADESVHSLIDLVYARTPYPEFQRRVRIHPNVSELLPFVLEDLTSL